MLSNKFIFTPLTVAIAASLASLFSPGSAMALVYNVDRAWTEGSDSASLTGTVDVPLGNYTITNAGADPFTNVDLTLNVNGDSYLLNDVSTDLISGTGSFFINANSSDLIFDTANANSTNPADLKFFNSSAGPNDIYYAIGSNGNPNFEVTYINSDSVLASVSFPVTFGTTVAIPEPSTILGTVSAIGLFTSFKRKQALAKKKSLDK